MQSRIYNTGSIIYFSGDNPEYIYILKQGMAQTIYTSIDTGYEERKPITLGEFFGMKSLLAGVPQEETVQCLTDCSIILITPKEFEVLACQNIKIIVKMMKVFSNQLRRIGKKVRETIDAENIPNDPLLELYKMGDNYFKNKKYKYALYAYQKYMDIAGNDGKFYSNASEKVSECKSALKEIG